VSGLVLYLLGRPPRVGDEVEYAALRIRVTAVQGNGVTDARVSAARSAGRRADQAGADQAGTEPNS
jgi:CBS domain containing-hemolysin-like protein